MISRVLARVFFVLAGCWLITRIAIHLAAEAFDPLRVASIIVVASMVLIFFLSTEAPKSPHS